MHNLDAVNDIRLTRTKFNDGWFFFFFFVLPFTDPRISECAHKTANSYNL